MELRGQYNAMDFRDQIKLQQSRGYEIAIAEMDGEVVGAAGFVIGHKLAWGKHMYIDDLVVSKQHQSGGIGGQLIAWLRKYAQERGCGQLHLDSGVQRFAAHRFYLRNGFDIASHHFSVRDLGG